MLRGILVSILLAAVLICQIGCAGVGQGGWMADTQTIRLSEVDDGTTVHMEQGQKLIISLRQTPDECYEWDVEEIDADVLKFNRMDFLSDHPGVPCSGGDAIVHFDAVAGGSGHLRLVYAQGWIEAEREFEIWVVVR